MQTQLSGEQLSLVSIFCAQSASPATTLAVTQEWNDIVLEIEEKQERILKLKKEIGNAEEVFLDMEADELDLEPDEGEEVFYAEAPQLEADSEYIRAENEERIKELEEEIAELEVKSA